MYELKRTIPVNEPAKSFLSRHDVWQGLVMKANNALPFVPIMTRCDVAEKGEGWLVRDIVLNGVPLRERVTFEPEKRVIFDRIAGSELGRIENIIGEDSAGNLTLTFAFGLTKEGVPNGSDAERKHFSPMEGAYLNAVSSTLAAVRRTVDEQGREKLGLPHPTDTIGDASWIYEFFRAADSLDMERLAAEVTDDVQMTFANFPTAVGKAAFCGAIGGLWSRIKAMSHSITGAWSLHDGRIGIGELIVMYTRQNDSLYVVKGCTVLRRRGERIDDLRIHADVSQL